MMDLEELMNNKVSIEPKSEVAMNETHHVTVITTEEIKNMGFRQLEDILQIIPGYDLSMTYNSYYTVGIRGVRDSRNTSKLLVMVDGNPINQIFHGCAVMYGFDINIDNIERIEVIRGPGSALYGRNALSGVINIVTKVMMGKGEGNLGTFLIHWFSLFYWVCNDKISIASISLLRLYHLFR
jgi:outer membrane receptor for ferrienterochelin and colicin